VALTIPDFHDWEKRYIRDSVKALEEWLEGNDLANTKAWISDNLSGMGWDMDFREIRSWD